MSASSDPAVVLHSFLRPADHHRCLPLVTGLAAIDARRRLIRQAEKSISIATFLWRDDRAGRFLIEELCQQARAGVAVRILLDHWVVLQSEGAILRRFGPLVSTGTAEVRLFNPVAMSTAPDDLELAWAGLSKGTTLNHRMHGKVILFDDHAGIVGGRNLGSEYFDLHRLRCFSDAELLVQGPAVEDLRQGFEAFWNSPLTVELSKVDLGSPVDAGDSGESAADTDAAWIEKTIDERCPAYVRDVFEPASLEVIYDSADVTGNAPTATAEATLDFWLGAERSLRITSPILIFRNTWLRKLRELRQDHPEIQISMVTNSLVSTDNLYTYAAALQQRSRLIDDLGVHLHELRAVPADIDTLVPAYAWLQQENAEANEPPQSGFGANRYEYGQLHTTLHAKFAVADEHRLLLGSPNLDPRSLLSNAEILVKVDDAELASYFARVHDRYRLNRNSWVVAQASTRRWPAWYARLQLALHRLTGYGRWPYGRNYCFEPRPETDSEIPAPESDGFHEKYQSCGVYPGVSDSQERVELVFLSNLSQIFRELL